MLSRWRVLLGAVSQAAGQGQQVGVLGVVYHGGYQPFLDPNSEENADDIALVRLAVPVTFTGQCQAYRSRPAAPSPLLVRLSCMCWCTRVRGLLPIGYPLPTPQSTCSPCACQCVASTLWMARSAP